MLRDITIGQHFPGNSLVHRFDPRLKLVLTILYIVLLFAASNPLGLALSLVFLAAMYAVAKIPFRLILKSLKPIFPSSFFTAVLNLFFVSGEGDPVFKLGFLTVYAEGIRYAVLMAVRVMAPHRRHEPFDLHHQPHRPDGCHRAAAQASWQAPLPGA